MATLRFDKMDGCGNDFVVMSCLDQTVDSPSDVARAVSDRKHGIGSDGLILLHPSDQADVRMEMFNADGSRGSMCGNGIRCVAKYLIERQLCSPVRLLEDVGRDRLIDEHPSPAPAALPRQIVRALRGGLDLLPDVRQRRFDVVRVLVELDSGVRAVYGLACAGHGELFAVDMGTPSLRLANMACRLPGAEAIDRPLAAGGREYRITCVWVGNMHAVVFVDDIRCVHLAAEGGTIETSEPFPDGVNVGFVQVTAADRLINRTWERGCGATLSCGSGACAAVVAAAVTGRAGRSCVVEQKGGSMFVDWEDSLVLCGPARWVCGGDWSPSGPGRRIVPIERPAV